MNLLKIENRVGRVRLNDVVDPWSADELIGDIERVYGAKAVSDQMVVGGFMATDEGALEVLELDIHTPGGSILDGYRIHQSLMQMRERGVKVIANVNTLAASMGSVIIMAADEINIVNGGRIMIHEAAQTVSGNAADHARAAKNLDEMSDEIAAIYANRTGASVEEMRDLMKAETWMGAKEAVERGFADAIIGARVETTKEADIKKAMGLFSKNENAEAFAVLENRISELEADCIARDEELASARAEATTQAEAVASLNGELANAVAALEEAKNELAELSAEAEEATAKVESFDTELEAAVINRIAALGYTGSLPESAKDDADSAPNSLTRDAFNALSPSGKMAFVKGGGKLI
jgi:ATP-dependent protease ClpP protease subunit